MFVLFSALAAVIPMSSYLLIIWYLDKYEREPFKYIFYSFVFGAVGAVTIAYLISSVLSANAAHFHIQLLNSTFISAVIIAPLVEETTKGSFLFFNFIKRKIDNLTDGLVYGGAIGLGFGMTENFLYFIYYGASVKSWIILVIVRTIFSAVMHCISTAFLGAFLSISKFGNNLMRFTFPLLGIFTSITIHFIWNLTVLSKETHLYGFFFILIIIFIFAFLFFISLRNERNIITSELSEEAELNIIPVEHINLFKTHRYKSTGLIDENIRKKYINALTILAFRKMQYKNSSDIYKTYYAGEIENYRNYVKILLSKSV